MKRLIWYLVLVILSILIIIIVNNSSVHRILFESATEKRVREYNEHFLKLTFDFPYLKGVDTKGMDIKETILPLLSDEQFDKFSLATKYKELSALSTYSCDCDLRSFGDLTMGHTRSYQTVVLHSPGGLYKFYRDSQTMVDPKGNTYTHNEYLVIKGLEEKVLHPDTTSEQLEANWGKPIRITESGTNVFRYYANGIRVLFVNDRMVTYDEQP